MDRRTFLAAAGGALSAPRVVRSEEKLRVAVIGHTGRGNYGHGLDTVWLKIPGAEIVAVADADSGGRAKELKKLRLPEEAGYAEYGKMLAEVKPDYVSVCPRHADQHRDMALAAIEAGARGLYVEKPFCRTPAEADDLVAACQESGARIAVAHRNRYHPALAEIDKLVADGRIGRLLEIRGRGKGDRRGGGEDLWVLGSHVLNLIAYFGGNPKSCSAALLQDGRRIGAGDVVEGAEGLGSLAGNEVHARYELESGVTAYFDSLAEDGSKGAGFGLQLIGSGGVINLQCDRNPLAHLVPGNPFLPTDKPRPWIPISAAGLDRKESAGQQEMVARVGNHVAAVQDLIAACEEGREALCGVADGALTVEMICAAFESHCQDSRAVRFPLEKRDNALGRLAAQA